MRVELVCKRERKEKRMVSKQREREMNCSVFHLNYR